MPSPWNISANHMMPFSLLINMVTLATLLSIIQMLELLWLSYSTCSQVESVKRSWNKPLVHCGY